MSSFILKSLHFYVVFLGHTLSIGRHFKKLTSSDFDEIFGKVHNVLCWKRCWRQNFEFRLKKSLKMAVNFFPHNSVKTFIALYFAQLLYIFNNQIKNFTEVWGKKVMAKKSFCNVKNMRCFQLSFTTTFEQKIRFQKF